MPVNRVAILFVLVFFALLATTGCDTVTGSGETATWEMDYTAFDRLEISSGFEVTLTRSDRHAVSITVDKKLYEYLKIAQRGDTLHIGLKPGHIYHEMVRRAAVSLPDLRRLEVSGSAKVSLSGFTVTHPIDFDISGSSRLELGHTVVSSTSLKVSGASRVSGSMEMDKGSFDISGASSLELKGMADSLSLKVSGASSAELSDFPTATAAVDLSGASHAVINVSTRMDIRLSSASSLEFIGNPKLGNLDISGGSTLHQRR